MLSRKILKIALQFARGRSKMAANGQSLDLERLVRPNILSLKPYRCARDENKGRDGLFMDANENGYGSCIPVAGELHRYPDPYQVELKTRIAAFRGVAADQIFLGVGSDEAIDMIIRVFCAPGQHSILVTPPTYGMYKVSAAINDVSVQCVDLTPEFQLKVEEVLDAVVEETRVIFLCSPNNPAGETLHTADIRRILESPRFTGVVVIDEAYVDFSARGSLVTLVDEFPRLIVMQTLSKSFGLAGIRLGWAIAHRSIVSIFNNVKAPYNVSRLTAEMGLKAMSEEGVSAMKDTVAKIVEHKQAMIAELEGMQGVLKVYPTDTNFIMIQVAAAEARGVYNRLASERGVVIRYRGDQTHCTGCMRITVSKADENRRALDALAAELKLLASDEPEAKRAN
ncbi:histidinol-phosphate aminotransferase-like [Sycon ciliatum]|uniref:histidinol-phosphate aminotransferase-like n=1 Tax=Sycon ciliatum TaxID=27933 RepID=UPI0031F6DD34